MLHILGRKTGTSDLPGLKYTFRLIFLLDKQVPVAGTHQALYFGWGNKYLQPARPQVHAALHILGGKTDTCDRPGLKYTPHFIFWVEKQVLTTKLARPQVYVAPHIFV